MSGSVGGLTASHNRYGAYLRIRATPTNPNSPEQATVRSLFASLATLWLTLLTQAQRDAWTLYGQNVPVINRIGDPINLTGLNHYIRSNVPRLQAGLARVDDGPTVFVLATFTPPTFAAIGGAGVLVVAYDNTDQWAIQDGGAMLLYQGRQKAQTINYFQGPYRALAPVLGDTATPPTSPANPPTVFAVDTGNRIWMRVQSTLADGRLSAADVVGPETAL